MYSDICSKYTECIFLLLMETVFLRSIPVNYEFHWRTHFFKCTRIGSII